MSNFYMPLPGLALLKRKSIQKTLYVFGMFAILVMPLGSNFTYLNQDISANGGGIDYECEQQGFDFGVAKWEWEGQSYVVDGDANGTNVTGDNQSADWTANPAVDGVIRKAGETSQVFPGGTNGTVTAGDHDISHLTFCGNEAPEPYCELTLTKSDTGYDPIAPGDDLVYYITLENTGTANCTGGGVRLKDVFDQHTTYVSHELGGSYPSNEAFVNNSTYLKWNFATLHPGDFREIWLTMKVDDDIACDAVLTNKVKFYSNQTGWGSYVIEETAVECPVDPFCGDGNLDSGEQCDDANQVNGDGCSSTCQIEQNLCQNEVMYDVVELTTDDSSFYKYDVNSKVTTQIGSQRNNYSIKGSDIDPQTGIIYGFTGKQNDPASKKRLVQIDKITGIPLYTSGVQLDLTSGERYKAASFNPITNELWAAGANTDLRTVNLSNGTSVIKKNLSGSPMGLAWDLVGENLYIMYQNDHLDKYNTTTGDITTVCGSIDNFESLEFDVYGNLVVGYHDNPNGSGIDIFNLNTCQPVHSSMYDFPHSEVETMNFECEDNKSFCGDGIKQSPNDEGTGGPNDDGYEDCDGSDGVSEHQTCSNQCVLEDLTYCGDGIKQSPNDEGTGGPNNDGYEACDGTDGVGANETCSNTCELIYLPYCGDGNLDQGEQCDDGNNDNGDGCSAQCTIESGTIAGCKYNDSNSNGVIDNDEVTIPDWTIILTKPDQSQTQTVTDELGCYAFENLTLGTYQVSEEAVAGWTQTFPIDPDTYTVEITAPQTIGNKDFANYQEPGPSCGDGIVNQTSEECDEGDGNGNVCSPDYGDSCQYCSNSCTLITIDGPFCGDGVVNGSEQCDEGDGNGGELCTLECTYPIETMDIELNKEVNTDTVTVGDSVVFTITVENTGTLPATGVSVEERLPGALSYLSHAASKGNYYTDINTWSIGDLGAGAVATLTLTAQVNQEGSFTNVAEVISHNEEDIDSTPGNNIISEDDQDDAQVTATGGGGCVENCGGGGGGPVNPYIVLTKTASVSFTNPDTIVDYSLSVTNTGVAVGTNLVITDTLPAGLEYASTTVTGVWDLGNIDVGQTKQVEYQVKFPAGIGVGNYTNTAVAEISNGNSSEDDATVEVRIPTVYSDRYEPILAIDKTVDRTFTNPGGEAIYTVTITNTNTGDLIALNTVMVDRLPAEFTFAEDGTQVKGWQLGDLLPGESKTVSFTVNVKADTIDGTYDNLATAYADNAPEVSDIEPLEVRDVLIKGFVLPDTNGSEQLYLTILAGALMILLGYMVWKYRQLDSVRV